MYEGYRVRASLARKRISYLAHLLFIGILKEDLQHALNFVSATSYPIPSHVHFPPLNIIHYQRVHIMPKNFRYPPVKADVNYIIA